MLCFQTVNYNYLGYRIQHLVGNFEKFTYKSRHKKFYTAKSFSREIGNYFEIKQILGSIVFPKIQFNNKRMQNLLSRHIGILCKQKK